MKGDRWTFKIIYTDDRGERKAGEAADEEEEVCRFGVEPKVALLSYSNFGTSRQVSPQKMRKAKEILEAKAPNRG